MLEIFSTPITPSLWRQKWPLWLGSVLAVDCGPQNHGAAGTSECGAETSTEHESRELLSSSDGRGTAEGQKRTLQLWPPKYPSSHSLSHSPLSRNRSLRHSFALSGARLSSINLASRCLWWGSPSEDFAWYQSRSIGGAAWLRLCQQLQVSGSPHRMGWWIVAQVIWDPTWCNSFAGKMNASQSTLRMSFSAKEFWCFTSKKSETSLTWSFLLIRMQTPGSHVEVTHDLPEIWFYVHFWGRQHHVWVRSEDYIPLQVVCCSCLFHSSERYQRTRERLGSDSASIFKFCQTCFRRFLPSCEFEVAWLTSSPALSYWTCTAVLSFHPCFRRKNMPMSSSQGGLTTKVNPPGFHRCILSILLTFNALFSSFSADKCPLDLKFDSGCESRLYQVEFDAFMCRSQPMAALALTFDLCFFLCVCSGHRSDCAAHSGPVEAYVRSTHPPHSAQLWLSGQPPPLSSAPPPKPPPPPLLGFKFSLLWFVCMDLLLSFVFSCWWWQNKSSNSHSSVFTP